MLMVYLLNLPHENVGDAHGDGSQDTITKSIFKLAFWVFLVGQETL